MGKKTVAVIGETGEFCPALAKAAVQQDLRLLFISRDEIKTASLKEQLGQLNKTAEVEFLTCEREGCWEADAIVFIRPLEIEPLLLKKIEQVATQKLVLIVSGKNQEPEGLKKLYFQDLLPHSRVVELELTDAEFRIPGKNNNMNENEMVRSFFEAAGYHQKD